MNDKRIRYHINKKKIEGEINFVNIKKINIFSNEIKF